MCGMRGDWQPPLGVEMAISCNCGRTDNSLAESIQPLIQIPQAAIFLEIVVLEAPGSTTIEEKLDAVMDRK